ncbi:hypothetical protein [Streptomyces sp. NPDC059009]|uniref:hypothetical protein n=1 Tax=Streptomyces sp. NPDC059009 TaxID=3346694 RepID=UPI0036A976B5
MANSQHETMRRVLRREVAGTIGLLADAEDFAAMRRYRTFSFDDHKTYLREVEALLRALAAQGNHTSLALFDPVEYEEYCSDAGLDPDAPASRTRFTAELASSGPTLPYDGRPLADLLPDLVDESVRRATWEYATVVLARAGTCTDCGEDIGRAAFNRAASLLTRVLDTSDPGARHLVCSVPTEAEPVLAALHITTGSTTGTLIDESEALEFTTVLALGIATDRRAGLVLRTTTDAGPDRVQGWRLNGTRLTPLTASEVFDAYCTDAITGDLLSPEPGVDYCAAPDLDDGEPETGHTH